MRFSGFLKETPVCKKKTHHKNIQKSRDKGQKLAQSLAHTLFFFFCLAPLPPFLRHSLLIWYKKKFLVRWFTPQSRLKNGRKKGGLFFEKEDNPFLLSLIFVHLVKTISPVDIPISPQYPLPSPRGFFFFFFFFFFFLVFFFWI